MAVAVEAQPILGYRRPQGISTQAIETFALPARMTIPACRAPAAVATSEREEQERVGVGLGVGVGPRER